MRMQNYILTLIILTTLTSCYNDFDNKIAERDLKLYFPGSEIKQVTSYECDGTFGDCFYVDIKFRKNKSDQITDTTWQYMRTDTWTLNPSKTSQLKDDRQKLKNIGLCSCLYATNPNSDFWKNEGSGNGYVQTSNISIDAIELVGQKANEFSKKKYLSYENMDLTIMKCLDFYNSRELDSLVHVLVRE